LYKTDAKEAPAGIAVMEVAEGHALLWSHREKAWAYNPGRVVRFLDDYRNSGRFETVDRETAERVTPQITGGEKLPDEDTIAWVFQWRGEPPQSDD
jgi:hypothetical protein